MKVQITECHFCRSGGIAFADNVVRLPGKTFVYFYFSLKVKGSSLSQVISLVTYFNSATCITLRLSSNEPFAAGFTLFLPGWVK
jgi:hypothetical protein